MNGILMKPWKIKAISENPDMEWQTRWLSGLKEINKEPDKWSVVPAIMGDGFDFYVTTNLSVVLHIKPRYKVGELVYIKEAWRAVGRDSTDAIYKLEIQYKDGKRTWHEVNPLKWVWYTDNKGWGVNSKWRSPLFMPAWAARYFIRITGVEAQRLQEISIDDCKAEGIHGYTLAKGCLSDNPPDQRWNFIELWNTINKNQQWNTNPWIFKYRFKLEAKAES